MYMQPLKKLSPTAPKLYKNDPIEAVAILAGFTAKYQGGNRAKQDSAALIAVSLLNEGVSAVDAIERAAKRAMQS